jgi:hypothetical protein
MALRRAPGTAPECPLRDPTELGAAFEVGGRGRYGGGIGAVPVRLGALPGNRPFDFARRPGSGHAQDGLREVFGHALKGCGLEGRLVRLGSFGGNRRNTGRFRGCGVGRRCGDRSLLAASCLARLPLGRRDHPLLRGDHGHQFARVSGGDLPGAGRNDQGGAGRDRLADRGDLGHRIDDRSLLGRREQPAEAGPHRRPFALDRAVEHQPRDPDRLLRGDEIAQHRRAVPRPARPTAEIAAVAGRELSSRGADRLIGRVEHGDLLPGTTNPRCARRFACRRGAAPRHRSLNVLITRSRRSPAKMRIPQHLPRARGGSRRIATKRRFDDVRSKSVFRRADVGKGFGFARSRPQLRTFRSALPIVGYRAGERTWRGANAKIRSGAGNPTKIGRQLRPTVRRDSTLSGHYHWSARRQ